MTVCEMEDGMVIEPDCVYLNQPNTNIAVLNQTLQLIPVHESSKRNLPIEKMPEALNTYIRIRFLKHPESWK